MDKFKVQICDFSDDQIVAALKPFGSQGASVRELCEKLIAGKMYPFHARAALRRLHQLRSFGRVDLNVPRSLEGSAKYWIAK